MQKLTSEYLKKRMFEMKIKQVDLANMSGVAKSNISNYINGRSQPNAEITMKLLKALRLTIDSKGAISPIQEEKLEPIKAIKIPVLDYVQAGSFSAIGEYSNNEKLEIPHELCTSEKCFALKVRGDSMYKDGHAKSISDGDYVIVDPSRSANFGDIVVAVIDDTTATVKIFSGDGVMPVLIPLNDAHKAISGSTIKFNECCRIVGVVCAVIPQVRKF